MEVPEAFLFRLVHNLLNDLGFNHLADELIEQVHQKGKFLTDTNHTLVASTKRVRLFEWVTESITSGRYKELLEYLNKNVEYYRGKERPAIEDSIGEKHTIRAILNISEPSSSQLAAISLTMIYLIKRTIFLENLVEYSLNGGERVDNNSLIQYLSDELGPTLDSIESIPNVFDPIITANLNTELESPNLLSLVMQLPLSPGEVEGLIFDKEIIFYPVSLKSNYPEYLVSQLRKILVEKCFGKLFLREFYDGLLPFLNYEMPQNVLKDIVAKSIMYNRIEAPYYLSSRAIKDDNNKEQTAVQEFIPPVNSAINDYYKPKFPIQPLHTLATHSGQVWFTKFSPLGKYLITGAADGQLIIYDVLDNFEVLAVLTSDNTTDKNCFVNSPYKSITANRSVIYCCWDKNEDYIVSGSLDTKVRVWCVKGIKNKSYSPSRRKTRSAGPTVNTDEIRLVSCFILGERIRTWSCEFLPFNIPVPQFIIGSPDKMLKAFDVNGTELFDFYSNTEKNKEGDVDMKEEESEDYEDDEPDVDRGTVENRGNSQVHSMDLPISRFVPKNTTVPEPKAQESFSRINDLGITPDGKILITANNNKTVDFYTIPNLTDVDSVTTKILSLTLNGRLTSCSVSSNSRYLLLSMGPDELQVWDIKDLAETGTPKLYKKLTGHGQGGLIIRSCFGHLNLFENQEELVLSGSDDGHIYIWKLDTGRLITRVAGHSLVCNSVDWNTNFIPTRGGQDFGKLWCSVGDDKLVKIWGPPHFYES